jgi:hypothetical protein
MQAVVAHVSQLLRPSAPLREAIEGAPSGKKMA